MTECIFVGIGGFMGAVVRHLMGKIPLKDLTVFPINTLFINLLGAFLIGIIYAVSTKFKVESSNLVLLLKVGVCGGFTTFSTFSLETLHLVRDGHTLAFACYISFSLIGCILAVWFGELLFR